MPTGLESVLSFLPGATGYGLLAVIAIFALRYAMVADKRWHDEFDDHERTQKRLDEERDLRRNAEDELARVKREIAGLRADARRRGTQHGR